MIEKILQKFPWCNSNSGLLALRIGVGAIFIFTGWAKVSDLHATVAFFGSLGFAPILAYFVTCAELIGGILVLIGLFTRYAALFLFVIMIVAFYTVVKLQGLGMALAPFSLIASSICLMFSGSGRFAVKKD